MDACEIANFLASELLMQQVDKSPMNNKTNQITHLCLSDEKKILMKSCWVCYTAWPISYI